MISRFWLFAKILGNILLEGIYPITYEQENVYSRRLPAYDIFLRVGMTSKEYCRIFATILK